jgi:hypothetical protein
MMQQLQRVIGNTLVRPNKEQNNEEGQPSNKIADFQPQALGILVQLRTQWFLERTEQHRHYCR